MLQPGPPKEPKIMAQYPKIESIGSIGSIILTILEVQEEGNRLAWPSHREPCPRESFFGRCRPTVP